MNPLTYLILALSLAYILDRRIATASIFALVPDFDALFSFLYPFTSGGIMHSILAASVFTFLTYIYTEDRVSAESCILGYSSHLSLEIITYSKLALFFPIASTYSLSLVSAQNLVVNSAVITASVSAVFLKKNWKIFHSMVPFSKPVSVRKLRRR